MTCKLVVGLTLAMSLSVGVGARPADAGWSAGNHTVSGSSDTYGAGSSAGASGGEAYALALGGTCFGNTDGEPYYGSASYNVSRAYTKTGTPDPVNITGLADIGGTANASGFMGDSSYAFAESLSRASTTYYPNRRELHETATARYPVGPAGDGYSDNYSDPQVDPAAGYTYQMSASTTLTGYIFAYAEGNSNGSGASGNSDPNAGLAFSNP
jgi:hypothetical protein